MKTKLWIGILIIVVSILAAVLLASYLAKPAEEGFTVIFLEDNTVLISGNEVLSYNWTSQEIAIADAASERLLGKGDSLYSFSKGFVMRINGEEVYQGVFRLSVHSAIPSSPKISIMFPSTLFQSEPDNYHAVRMFYPSFEPPSDQPEANTKLSEYFEDAGKLLY
jgi:hypothetical protein